MRGPKLVPFPARPPARAAGKPVLAARDAALYLALELEDFPAQTLSAWDPAYRGRAYVVADQDPGNHKTFAIACSREARALGIHAGMPLVVIHRHYRNVGVTLRNPAWEAALCEELRALCLRYTPAFDVGPGGRALLDLAGTPALRALGPEALAEELRREIRARTGLAHPALGLAATRLLARVMARRARGAWLDPARGAGDIFICPPGAEAATLAPLTPDSLPGLSPQCREKIRRYAFASVGQIQRLGRQALAARFGGEGDKLHALACGLDPAEAPARRTDVTAETVLENDINDEDALARKVRFTADKLAFHLRREGLTAEKLAMTLRYSDQRSARKTLPVRPGTDDFTILAGLARRLFLDLYQRRVALRSIALSVPRPGMDRGQTDLFEALDGMHGKRRALGNALAKIRARSGFDVIVNGGSVE